MHGLYVLWWVRERHIPVAAVAATLAASDLAVSVLELPTGWVADRFGHRASLIAGSLLQIAGMVLAWQGRSAPAVVAACLLIAAGDAFRSGADQALLFRSCLALGERSFQRREAHARALQLAALVALVLAGGAIVRVWGFDAGWLVETLLCVGGLAIAAAMIEPPPHDDGAGDGEEERAGAGSAAGVEAPRARRLAALIAIVMPAALLGAATAAGMFVVQSATDADPVGMTVFVATATLAEAGGALAGARAAAAPRTQLALLALGAALFAAAIVVPYAFQPGIVALCFLTGVAGPLRAAAIQSVASDRVRARAASLASACDKIVGTVSMLIAGAVPRGKAR
jgi:MFS transporter